MLAGHADLSTTQRHIEADVEAQKKVVELILGHELIYQEAGELLLQVRKPASLSRRALSLKGQ